jgi:hypothetical protein
VTLSAKGRREKGAAYERHVVSRLKFFGWPHAERTSDGRTQTEGDIRNGPAGCHIECKRHEKLNVAAAFDQVKEHADALDIPVLIHRPSRHVDMATLPLTDLLPLLALREMGL